MSYVCRVRNNVPELWAKDSVGIREIKENSKTLLIFEKEPPPKKPKSQSKEIRRKLLLGAATTYKGKKAVQIGKKHKMQEIHPLKYYPTFQGYKNLAQKRISKYWSRLLDHI